MRDATLPARPQAPAHAAEPVAPWYGDGRHAALHRYLADDFVAQFQQQLAEGSLAAAESRAWLEEDRFAADRSLVLRQPVHRTFYVVSAEVCCRMPGRPPLDPRKIASAGMVIRRRPAAAPEQAWTLLRGVALGWETAVPGVDPDVRRRLARVRGSRMRDDGRPCSGELVHPLHATSARDADGRLRTVVWGFLPVGSGSRPVELPAAMRARLARRPAAGDELAGAKSEMAVQMQQALPRPFGARNGTVAREDGVHLDDGKASPALAELLGFLVRQLGAGAATGASADPAQVALASRLAAFALLDGEGRSLGRSLLDWLEAVRASESDEPRLNAWLDVALPFAAGAAATARVAARLPDAGGGELRARLVVDAGLAQELRAELVASHGACVDQAIDDVTVPRFGQRDDDVYVALPFVRVRDGGCEHVRFGAPTQPFRVAAPLDPQAARPVQIALPKLSDLKKALPKASFLAPDDLAEKLLSIPLGKGLSPDLAPTAANTFGLCWSFSFSLPAITICALIVLMIVLSLLDLFFHWLPFVFLRLPMLCLGIKKP